MNTHTEPKGSPDRADARPAPAGGFTREAPPARVRSTPFDWTDLIVRIAQEAPDEWVIGARNVSKTAAIHLKRRFNVDARVVGVSEETARADRVYIRFNTGSSTITEAGERILERQRKAQALREKIAAKKRQEKAAERASAPQDAPNTTEQEKNA